MGHAGSSTAAAHFLPRQLVKYQQPVAWKSWWQVANTLVPFFGLTAAMFFVLDYSYWLSLALAVPAGGLMVRAFIIQHDCGHGSFFRSRVLNDGVGMLCGLLTLTPYLNWRRQHANHHAKWNHLDRRDVDVDLYSRCLTVDEYSALSRWQRLRYRLLRNPIVLFVLLPPLIFLVLYRFPFDTPASWRRERINVHATNLAVAIIVLALGWAVGFVELALVYTPIIAIASIAGVWLFSVQHQFAETSWQGGDRWSFMDAALKGSSFLRLPGILRWFTGNIGFHHVHHLNPRIPNYRLRECHAENPALHVAPVLTLWTGLESTLLGLWDEDRQRLVRIGAAGA